MKRKLRFNGLLLVGLVYSKAKSLGISGRAAAKEMKVHNSIFSRLKQGYQIDMNNFCKIVDWLGVGVDEFFREV